MGTTTTTFLEHFDARRRRERTPPPGEKGGSADGGTRALLGRRGRRRFAKSTKVGNGDDGLDTVLDDLDTALTLVSFVDALKAFVVTFDAAHDARMTS